LGFFFSFFSSVKSTNLGKFSPNFRHENFEKKDWLEGSGNVCVREGGSSVVVACG
jgi:hypothetical protein